MLLINNRKLKKKKKSVRYHVSITGSNLQGSQPRNISINAFTGLGNNQKEIESDDAHRQLFFVRYVGHKISQRVSKFGK